MKTKYLSPINLLLLTYLLTLLSNIKIVPFRPGLSTSLLVRLIVHNGKVFVIFLNHIELYIL